MTNYNGRLDKIIDQLSDSSAARGWLDCKSGSEDTHPRNDLVDIAKQSLTSRIKELVAGAKPEEYEDYYASNPVDKGYKMGYNNAIREFEQNLLKALEEV